MKRIAPILLAAVGALLLLAPLTAPPAGAAGGTGKVAVIDLERTLYETPAGKRASEAFDKTRKAKQAKLDKEQKELQKYAAELDKQATVLKPDVLEQKRADLQKKFVTLQELYVNLERELSEERTKLVQDLLKKAGPFVEQLAKDEGVDLIVDSSAVVWANSAVDLTEKLNKKMK
ncbi:MAG: OmpH family outer membrane protein [Kofleriaceae bacterium]|nr:OmpH family outer membrane protein [Myxococcales bacterium]MCB9565473.1 OmpH family outer membrane protein [Kofleriaceae bacterium]MCB9573211.1 OmpH family outer membrane protein [Kofleriaceae bacterium]